MMKGELIALLILFIFYVKNLQKSNLSLDIKLKWGEISLLNQMFSFIYLMRLENTWQEIRDIPSIQILMTSVKF